MNKTISINLGGWFFHIEEEAYNRLHHYLSSLGKHFSGEEGAREIVEDIEARIAEMFQEALNKHKRQVVLPGDVETMIAIMGHPEEFDHPHTHESHADLNNSNEQSNQSPQNQANPNTQAGSEDKSYRRLYRNPDDQVLGGVCSGISAYFGISDPIWIRLAFVAAFFLFGWGVLLYIILWAIVPEASTAAQKLAMKGEPINVHNLEKTFREGFHSLKDQIEDFSKSEGGKNTRFFFEQLTSKLRQILPKAIWITLKVVKIGVIIGGVILLFSLVVALLGIIVGLFASAKFLLTFIFSNALLVILGIISLLMLFAIPILGITYWFTRKAFKINTETGRWKAGAVSFWVFCFFVLLTVSAKTYNDAFSQRAMLQEEIAIAQPIGNTIYISALPDTYLEEVRQNNKNNAQILLPIGNWGKTTFDYENNALFFESVKLDVVESEDDQFRLIKSLSAFSGTQQTAENLAQHIEYVFDQEDSILHMNPYYSAPAGDKWRNQQIHLTLKVPKGKSVFFNPGSEQVIYDVKNVSNTLDSEMIGKRWDMLEGGLTNVNAGVEKLGIENEDDSNLLDENEDIDSEAALEEETSDPTSINEQGIEETTETGEPKIVGNQKLYDITDFEELEISGMFKVNVQQGSKYKVAFSGDEASLANLNLIKSGNTLSISTRQKKWWNWLNQNNQETLEVTIVAPEITEIELNGACKATITGFKNKDEFNIIISGVSEAVTDINTGTLNAEVSGASSLTLSGKAKNAEITVSGSSGLKAFNFAVKEMVAEVSGVSQAEVNVSDKLTAEASGASGILYKGNTTNVQSETSGASSVKAKE